MPIFVPDIFSGYLNGRRAAIQDNWNDLTNFNTVLGGQLQNAYNMDTMADRVRMTRANANTTDANQAVAGSVADNSIAYQQSLAQNNVPSLQAQAEATGYQQQAAQNAYDIQGLDPQVQQQRLNAKLAQLDAMNKKVIELQREIAAMQGVNAGGGQVNQGNQGNLRPLPLLTGTNTGTN